MKLAELYEAKEVNLIGMKIKYEASDSKRLITSDTPNKQWTGYFNCQYSNLTSLKGAPKSVSSNFRCYTNDLVSLEGAPSTVGRDFDCSQNKLNSLEGTPSSVGGNFYCFSNDKLKSLKDIHKIIKEIKGGRFDADGCPIVSHVLGLLKIKGLKEVLMSNVPEVRDILNKWLKEPYGNGRVMGAQSELIDAGLDEFAQL